MPIHILSFYKTPILSFLLLLSCHYDIRGTQWKVTWPSWHIEGKWLVSLQKYCPDTVVWCFHNAHLIKHVLCMLYSRNCEYTTLFIVIHTFVQIYKEKKSGHISNTEKLLKRVMAKELCWNLPGQHISLSTYSDNIQVWLTLVLKYKVVFIFFTTIQGHRIFTKNIWSFCVYWLSIEGRCLIWEIFLPDSMK